MSIPDEAVGVMSSGLTMEQEIALYNAVGRFAEASRLSVERQKAVVDIGRIIKGALIDAEQAALERAAQVCERRERYIADPLRKEGIRYCIEAIHALMSPLPARESHPTDVVTDPGRVVTTPKTTGTVTVRVTTRPAKAPGKP